MPMLLLSASINPSLQCNRNSSPKLAQHSARMRMDVRKKSQQKCHLTAAKIGRHATSPNSVTALERALIALGPENGVVRISLKAALQ